MNREIMFDYRVLYPCEYEVDSGDCGEPATHLVWWDTFGKGMKVCTEHFNYIKKCEETTCTPTHKGGE